MNNKTPLVSLSHSGKQHSYHVAKSLLELGYLDKFYTSSYIKNQRLQDFFTKTNNTFWTRRFVKGLSGNKIETNWQFELKEFLFRKLYGKNEKVQNAVYERDVKFDNYIAKIIGKRPSNIFWGFQGSCHNSLIAAKKSGKITICELSTAHVVAAKKILGEEQKLHPEWADSIDNLEFPSDYEKRLIEEPLLADYCIAASKFTEKSLIEIGKKEKQILKLPLGFEADKIDFHKGTGNFTNRPLKLLYVGTITQRKGIKYLLEAIKTFKPQDVELHIIGGIQGSGNALNNYKKHFTYHQPIAQNELFRFYKNFDVLVLPTIFEGFGLVIVEAMAAGLPVITTSHSIGEELIENDKNGYIVPIRDILAIQKSIERFKEKTTNEYLKMRIEARNSVEVYSWTSYTNNLQKMLSNIKTR